MSAVPQLLHDLFRSALEDSIECRVVAQLGRTDRRQQSPFIGVEQTTFAHSEFFRFLPKADIVVAASGHLPTNQVPQVQCCKVSPCEEWGGCTWTKLSFSLTEKPMSG
jgi:hypothetical protein